MQECNLLYKQHPRKVIKLLETGKLQLNNKELKKESSLLKLRRIIREIY